jgi:hypothetical protein
MAIDANCFFMAELNHISATLKSKCLCYERSNSGKMLSIKSPHTE